MQFKRSLDYYLNLLDTRLADRDYLGALDAGRNALTESKTRIDKQSINLILSEIYFLMGLHTLSCEYAFFAVKTKETRASAYFCIGKNLVRLKKPKLALKYLNEALNYSRAGEFVGAVLEWTDEIKSDLLEQKYEITSLDIIKNMVRYKQYDDAIALVQPYVNKGDIEYQILYCDILVQNGDFNTAREMLLNILNFDSENINALIVLSALCLGEHDYFSLGINVDKLKELDLNNKQLETLANIQAKSEDYTGAIETYQKILKNDEFNTKILLFVSVCYHNLKNTKEALYYIGRARWIDLDNPTLNIFYEIMNGNNPQILPVSTSIPYDVGQKKLDNLFEAIELKNFEDLFCSSLTLAGDVEWCFTLKNADFTKKIIQKLAKSRKKEISSFYEKQLLTMRINSRQKFFLTKYALFEEHLKTVDFTTNFYYKSFKLKIPKFINENSTLKLGYCGAVSFAEINNLDINLAKINKKLNNQNFDAIDYHFTENLVSCLYFCENNQILEQACIYFDTPKYEVLEAVKSLNLL